MATEYIRLLAATAATAASEGSRPAGGAGSAPTGAAATEVPAAAAAVVVMRPRMAASGGAGKMASHVRKTLSRFLRSTGRTSQIAQNAYGREQLC